MNRVKKSLAALAASILVAASAQAQSPAATTETSIARYPGPLARTEVCVHNTMDRTVGLTTSWNVGDSWNSTHIGAGQTMIFALVADAGSVPNPRLTVRYREYFLSPLIATATLWSSATYPGGSCSRGPAYVIRGEDDGHLRQHVVILPLMFTVASPE